MPYISQEDTTKLTVTGEIVQGEAKEVLRAQHRFIEWPSTDAVSAIACVLTDEKA
jgi:hypothetical protein